MRWGLCWCRVIFQGRVYLGIEKAYNRYNRMNIMKILHAFADTGIECEVLSLYGYITRVGINPSDNPFTDELIKSDATNNIFRPGSFDLSVWHPPCQRWSVATQGGGKGRDTHPNHIPRAREIAQQVSEHYIIENVPNAPLKNPTVLTGRMFGLPIVYKRAFETSWNVPQPTKEFYHPATTTWEEDQGTKGWQWIGNQKLWGGLKDTAMVGLLNP